MPKLVLLLTYLLFITSLGRAQEMFKIDSLNTLSFKLRSLERDNSRELAYEALRLSKRNDYEDGINQARLNLGIHFCNIDILDSASFYLNNSYQYWLTKPNSFYLSINNWYQGKLYQKLGDFKKAFIYLHQAEKEFEIQQDTLYQLYVLTEEGVYYELQGEYPNALDKYLKAYELRQHLEGTDNSIVERSNIASVYAQMGMIKEAKEYERLSLNVAFRSGSKNQLAVELRNMGRIFYLNNEPDSAIYYYNKALGVSTNTNQKALPSSILADIANIYNHLGILKDANENLLKAKQLANGLTLLDVYLQLGKNYKSQSALDSSLYYLSKCILLSEQRGSKKHLVEAAKLKMDNYSQLGFYDSAFYYSKLVKQYSDLLYNEKKDKRFNKLRIQLGLLEKEKEIEALKLVRYQDQVRTFRIISGIVFMLVLILILLFVNRVNHKKKRKKLELQLKKSKSKLSSQTLSMIHRNNAFEEIEKELLEVRSRCNGNADPGLRKIQQAISLNKSLETDWDNFSTYFSELHGGFFNFFESQPYTLSDYEFRLCALIKLKLTNKEIATILSIEHKSVKMAKYRLKKKVNLQEDKSLDEYINSIS